MQNLILNNKDVSNIDDLLENQLKPPVHIRVFQRSARKRITTIEDLDRDLNLKKIVKAMRHEFCCTGNSEKKEKVLPTGETKIQKIIKLSGDQRDNVVKFLTDYSIVEKERIQIHGG